MASLVPQVSDQHKAQEEDIDDLVPSSPKASVEALPEYKFAFLQSCLSASALTFGTFTLKSGRQSPYFFNSGLLHSGSQVRAISTAFAQTLQHHCKLNPDFEFDVLFGPAYKGIPLAASTADKLSGIDEKTFGKIVYSFNRKEIKDHGEKSVIGGASITGKKVVIIDDVITAGTAIQEAVSIIRNQGGTLVGIVVALDRMERMNDEGPGSAIDEVRKKLGVPVISIIDLNDLISLLGGAVDEQDVLRMEEYRRRYGASDGA